jgi:ZIP family zinc transporter
VTPLLRTTLLYSLVPVAFTVAGAAAGAFLPAMARLRAYVLHLAAGVVFSVVAVELLPEIQRRALVWDVVLGFALGIGTMLAVDRVLDRVRGAEDDDRSVDDEKPLQAVHRPRAAGIPLAPRAATAAGATSLGLIVAVGIDFLLDGLLLGVGFAAGARIGILLALAEAAEQLSVGLALAGEMTRAGTSRTRVMLVVSALGMLVFVSAVLGVTLLSGLTGGAMEVVLSFGLAALLYLVTEELLREAHEERETTLATAMFFVGFLAFLVVGMTLD